MVVQYDENLTGSLELTKMFQPLKENLFINIAYVTHLHYWAGRQSIVELWTVSDTFENNRRWNVGVHSVATSNDRDVFPSFNIG